MEHNMKQEKQNISNVDYYLLTRLFLKEVRGNLTQRELSKRLGYSFNQVGKWETGAKQIKWDDFLKVAKKLKIPLEEKLRPYFANHSESFTKLTLKELMVNFFALHSINHKRIEKIIKKWKTPEFSPDLAELFLMIDSRPSMLIGFLSNFIDCTKINVLQKHFEGFTKSLNLISNDPKIAYVFIALHVDEYVNLKNHSDEIIAKHAVCSVNEAKLNLKKLHQVGAVDFNGKKYFPGLFSFSYSNLNNPLIRKFNKYTLVLAGEKYPIDPLKVDRSSVKNISIGSFRVAALSENAAREVSKKVSKFHNEVSEILENDKDVKANVQIIIVNSFASCISEKK